MKQKIALLTVLVSGLLHISLNAQDKMIEKRCLRDFDRVKASVEKAITDKGFTIFAAFDHGSAATSANLQLRPTFVLVFGKPAVGTKLMQCDQLAGYDLPLRLLIRTDENNNVLLCYRDPMSLMSKYNLSDCKSIVENMSRLMEDLTQNVATKEK